MTEETKSKSRRFYRYPEEIREQARMCFMAGYGYKKTAAILKINVYTVRDWKREWVKQNPKGREYFS